MPHLSRCIGIDYSGAKTATSGLPGLRVYVSADGSDPAEVPPPRGGPKHWTRRGAAEWLLETLRDGRPTLVGIDHAFSFPLEYFDRHQIAHDWNVFLEDFCRHWPTDGDETTVDHVRRGEVGKGAERSGNARWRRLADRATGSAKSVFHFDVQGSVAKSTHAGLPWLRFVRAALGDRLHVWPFDGWEIFEGCSVIAEIYPSLWRNLAERGERTADQHDAYVTALWLSRAAADGSLALYLSPDLTISERERARVEGWILGVGDGGQGRSAAP